MEKSSQIAWKLLPLRHIFPLKVVPRIEVLLYSTFAGFRGDPVMLANGSIVDSAMLPADAVEGYPVTFSGRSLMDSGAPGAIYSDAEGREVPYHPATMSGDGLMQSRGSEQGECAPGQCSLKVNAPPAHVLRLNAPAAHIIKVNAPPAYILKVNAPPAHVLKMNAPATHVLHVNAPAALFSRSRGCLSHQPSFANFMEVTCSHAGLF
jgi:hypothetical protein